MIITHQARELLQVIFGLGSQSSYYHSSLSSWGTLLNITLVEAQILYHHPSNLTNLKDFRSAVKDSSQGL